MHNEDVIADFQVTVFVFTTRTAVTVAFLFDSLEHVSRASVHTLSSRDLRWTDKYVGFRKVDVCLTSLLSNLFENFMLDTFLVSRFLRSRPD